jgi:hypothetical protein
MARLRRDPRRCSDTKCGCTTEISAGAACHTAQQMFMAAMGFRRIAVTAIGIVR